MISTAIQQKLDTYASESRTLWLGYSGGLDSTVLLYLIKRAYPSADVRALHVHHGLSESADGWATHCQAVCEKLGVPLSIENVSVENQGKGLENAAREARYRAFQKYVNAESLLLLAHHQNDQAETMLFRLVRGTGLRGLVAMQEEAVLNGLHILRPLLACSRKKLEAYAGEHDLSWIEDESNANEAFDRNFIRRQVVPVLEKVWPNAVQKMGDAAAKLGEQQRLLNDYLDQDLISLGRAKERVGESIDLAVFSALTEARQKALIQRWCELQLLSPPNQAHLALLSQTLDAKEDAFPCLNWGNAELRRFRQKLYLLPKLDLQSFQACRWDAQLPISLGQGFTLICENTVELNLVEDLEIRPRVNAERCQPSGRQHSQSIKKLLQEYALEPWLRDLVPCVYYQNELVAVGDLWVCTSTISGLSLELHWGFECE